VPWALYTLLTAMLFHVELRYRLPLYPALLPYAAWTLARIFDGAWRRADWRHRKSAVAGAALTCLALLALTLLHRPYASEAWMLAGKHWRLRQADRALVLGDAAGVAAAASAALERDPDSVLARVALARAALIGGDEQGALAVLDDAIAALRAHPQAHLLRGAILRGRGDTGAARAELGYEQASLEDLQRWSWDAFAPLAAVPPAVDVGAGLDLGFVRGFWPAEPGGYRWSTSSSEVQLAAPPAGGARLSLELNGGRPDGAPAPQVIVEVAGAEIGRLVALPDWRSYSFDIPAALVGGTRRLVVTLRANTFRPRDLDRASPDNRALGVMVRRVEVVIP
jgi:hypothetical protein